jgi:hypothetical protein
VVKQYYGVLRPVVVVPGAGGGLIRKATMSKVVWRFFRRKAGREDSEAKPVEPTSDQEAIEQQVAALMSVWNKASLGARRVFLTRIDQRILTAHRTKGDPGQCG